jgi:major curlin subunit
MTITDMLKTGLGGLIVTASFGLLCLPAKADKIIQINTQITGQDGNSNTSVQQTSQTAEIDKKKIRAQLNRADDYDYLRHSSETSRQDKFNRYGNKKSSRDDSTRNLKTLGDRRVNPH